MTIRISDQGMLSKAVVTITSLTGNYLPLGGGLLSPEIRHPSDLYSFSHLRNPHRMDISRLGALRVVRSSQQGMTATVDEQVNVWKSQAHSEDPQQNAGIGSHPRIGIGLPMSNIFAT